MLFRSARQQEHQLQLSDLERAASQTRHPPHIAWRQSEHMYMCMHMCCACTSVPRERTKDSRLTSLSVSESGDTRDQSPARPENHRKKEDARVARRRAGPSVTVWIDGGVRLAAHATIRMAAGKADSSTSASLRTTCTGRRCGTYCGKSCTPAWADGPLRRGRSCSR